MKAGSTHVRRYVELWRLPSAPLLIVAGIIGRLPAGIAPLALLLFLADHTGSYGVGGVAVGIYGLATAAVAPMLGRYADRRGFTAVLVGTGVAYPAAIAVLVFTTLADAPPVLIYLAAALAGGIFPQLSAALRAIWTDLPGAGNVRQTAFALDAIALEVVWMIGPVLVATAVAVGSSTWGPAVALLGSGAFALVGSLTVALSRAGRRWRPRAAQPGDARRSPLRARGMVPALIAAFALLFGTGAIEAAMAGLADDQGRPAMAGVLLSIWSVGSALGGLWFGAQRFAAPIVRQYRWTLALCALGFAPLAFLGNAWLIGLVLFLGGTAFAPAITLQNTLIAALAPTGSVTESFTWLSTVTYAAVAAGTAIGGLLVDRPGGVFAALLLAAFTAVVAWATAAWPGTGLYAKKVSA
ncbi:MFS transporter [Cryptosporangium phraense]|uniref:MFS transporter n=1 Tax=Cryptosporangium phraense TaxID=2593070 RepID=A0A545AUL2_9ACTN|nr:MFS transporter [Cryptosporangium phraense]TQS45028.1 MFS transporter [Cryptosporangium phraense]